MPKKILGMIEKNIFLLSSLLTQIVMCRVYPRYLPISMLVISSISSHIKKPWLAWCFCSLEANHLYLSVSMSLSDQILHIVHGPYQPQNIIVVTLLLLLSLLSPLAT